VKNLEVKNTRLLTLSFLFLFLTAPTLAQNQTTEEYTIQIDPNTRIVDANWNQEGVSILFESEIPRPITITDVNSIAETGASQVNFKRTTLTSGRTRVNMTAESRRGSKTITVAAGQNMVAVSNPTQPLLQDVNRSNVYVGIASGALWLLINLVSQHKYQIRKIQKHPRKIL
jgi:hypothetical protein